MPITSIDSRRRAWLLGSTGVALTTALPSLAFARGAAAHLESTGVALTTALPSLAFARGAAAHLEMWSDEGCECCTQWAKHLRNHQVDVTQRHVDDVAAMRKGIGMPEKYAGCHVARVGRYVIDGHVPALDVLRLLREQPQAIGLAVPDMPVGSPGMERTGKKDPFQVLLIGLDGNSTVFKSYL